MSWKKPKVDTTREPGCFAAIPHSVLDSVAYQGLSHTAKALLVELARQCHGDDNGRLLLSRKYLAGRGWKSADVIQRAKIELQEAGLIFQTVQGCRPNKASWYAVTWYSLAKIAGYDIGIESLFVRGAYRMKTPIAVPERKRLRPVPSPHWRQVKAVANVG